MARHAVEDSAIARFDQLNHVVVGTDEYQLFPDGLKIKRIDAVAGGGEKKLWPLLAAGLDVKDTG
jgi:hypothetical protein